MEVTKIGLTEEEISNLYNSMPDIKLDLSLTREAESRLKDAQFVNPSTYTYLESVFNASYRELKRNLAEVSFKISKAQADLKMARSEAILDKYPEFLIEQVKKYPEEMRKRAKDIDSSQIREAFIDRDCNVVSANNRIDMLKALEHLLDGKIKVMERTCAYIRKEIDLIIRSGSINSNKYGSM